MSEERRESGGAESSWTRHEATAMRRGNTIISNRTGRAPAALMSHPVVYALDSRPAACTRSYLVTPGRMSTAMINNTGKNFLSEKRTEETK